MNRTLIKKKALWGQGPNVSMVGIYSGRRRLGFLLSSLGDETVKDK